MKLKTFYINWYRNISLDRSLNTTDAMETFCRLQGSSGKQTIWWLRKGKQCWAPAVLSRGWEPLTRTGDNVGQPEGSLPVQTCGLIVENAYDHVPCRVLCRKLREYGAPGSLLRAIRFLLNQSESCDGKLGTKSNIRSGCWTLPGMSLVPDPVCDIHGNDH